MLKFLNETVLLKYCRLFLNLFYVRGKHIGQHKGNDPVFYPGNSRTPVREREVRRVVLPIYDQ